MEHLEIIKDAIFLIAIGCGVPVWIITVIKNGQKDALQKFAESVNTLREEYKKDRKQFSSALKKRVSKDECSKMRAQCPYCNNNK